MKNKSSLFLEYLHRHYKDAKCALDFSNDFECLIAILLSAQTTDQAVNKVTPSLFAAFKTPIDLAKANLEDIEEKIRSLGLYRNKARALKNLGIALTDNFDGKIPLDFEVLKTLPGVGSKTAGVFLLERDDRPAIPVDTHVGRVSQRLGYAKKSDNPIQIEAKLEKEFPKDEWKFLHHAIIAFGRNECKAIKPSCGRCPMKEYCSYFKKISSTTDK